MKNSLSILKFVNNPVGEESIALGLVILSNEKVFFKISRKKLDFAKKLNIQSAKLLDFSLKQSISYLAPGGDNQSGDFIEFKKHLDQEFLQRLSKYNNGILQFSNPSFIKSDITEFDFDNYFNKFIGYEVEHLTEVKSVVKSRLETNLENKFVNLLSDRIDVNITLKKKQLPSLFFDFDLDGLGANGSLYVVKSLDLDTISKSNAIKEISEYESVLERLIDYSSGKGINGEPMTYLVMDHPHDKNSALVDLYSYLKNEKMPFFKIVASEELDTVSTEIIFNKAKKFSPKLLSI